VPAYHQFCPVAKAMEPRARDWWLLIKPDDVDVCDDDPGLPVTVTITADLAR